MIALCFLVSLSASRKTVSQVLTGDWSGRVTYSSPPISDLNLTFTLAQGRIPNYLSTTFAGLPVQINFSFVDLSGNVTYDDGVFDFNFTRKAPPFVSSDINLGDLGFLHCMLASYEGVRCAYANEGSIISLFFRKTSQSPGFIARSFVWLRQNFLGICLIVVLLIVYYLFKRWTDREQEFPGEPEGQKEGEAETAGEGKGEGETAGESGEGKAEAEEEKPPERSTLLEETGEEQETKPQPLEADEHGKFKTE
jgi:hypothetical protein